MKNFLRLTVLIILVSVFNSSLNAQTIDEVIIPGAVASNSGGTWNVEFFSSTNSTTNKENYKEIKLVQTGTKGEYIIWDATSGSSDWEIVQGQPTGGSWFQFCKPMLENEVACNGTCTTSYYIRHVGTTSGEFKATIKVGISTATSNKNTSCTYNSSTAFTVEATVNKVASDGIYTWIEPASGSDSSYKIAGNWSPTRTTPKSTDVLVVDLATTSTMRNTTIFMDGVNDDIAQFKIFPYNNVTFKCSTSSNSAIWDIGAATSNSGTDFLLDTLAGMRIDGGTMDLSIISGNDGIFKSDLVTKSGTLKFDGAGEHHFRKNINTVGGTLWFEPTSGTNTLYLEGTNTNLSGTGGTLYIDSNMNVQIGNGSTSTYTLNRTLPIISNLTLAANTTLVSNSAASSSVSDLRAWTPYLQLKARAKPNSTVHGQLLEVPSTASITGGALFEIYNNKQRAYRSFGIPLKDGMIIPQLTDDIDVTGTVTGSNANLFTTTCSWCTHSLFSWDETNSAWSPYSSGNSITTVPIGTGMLTFFRGARGNGLGDTSKAANEQVLDFKGALQLGSKTITLSDAGSGSLAGHNLVGNPFPCTIDLREVYESNKSNITPRFYIYDAISRRYNEWDSVGKGGNAPTRNGTSTFSAGSNRNKSKFLAPGAAAFFIVASNPTATSVTFNESHKVSSGKSATKHFSTGVQEENSTPCNTIKAEMYYKGRVSEESDGFTMEFDDENYDHTGDRIDMSKLYAGYMGLGTLTDNDWWLSIDRRGKMAEVGESRSVALKTMYPKELVVEEMEMAFNYCTEGLSSYTVKLIDKVIGTQTDVTDGTTYSFNISTDKEKQENRFDLIFTGIEKSNSIENVSTQRCVVYPNPSDNGLLYVVSTESEKIQRIRLLDATGKLIKNLTFKTQEDISKINTANIPVGYYLLEINTNKGTETHKIAIQ